MNVTEILNGVSPVEIRGDSDIEVTGVAKDSRAVQKGYIYIATGRGSAYLQDALNRGADVLVTDEIRPEISFPCTVIVNNPEKWTGQLAARFYAFPSREMHIAGVTGTNGKTTITFLIESILKCAGRKPGVIGTITHRYGEQVIKAENTTPGAVEIQALLNQMQASGVTNVIMEVSSHALHQRRVEAVEFDTGIFTNLTHDHLDYHLNFQNYKEAKKLLFGDYLKASMKEKKYAILNIDDPAVKDFALEPPTRVLSYSTKGFADAHLTRYEEGIEGIRFTTSLMGTEVEVSSPMIGAFNASNILAAMLYGVAADIPLSKIKEGVEKLRGVPGRLERIRNNRGISVFVDYAHTPDALNNVLLLLKGLKKGRLIVVFGCGGDRDTSKRPIMGSVATSHADFTILTSDNPRHEDPLNIIRDIEKGVNGNPYKVVENRKEAIKEALQMAQENDVVLIAGKGHEDYQKIGEVTHHFSDREVVEEALYVAP